MKLYGSGRLLLCPGHGEYCGGKSKIWTILLGHITLDKYINLGSGYFFPVVLHKGAEGLCCSWEQFWLSHLCVLTKAYVMAKKNGVFLRSVFGKEVEVISAEWLWLGPWCFVIHLLGATAWREDVPLLLSLSANHLGNWGFEILQHITILLFL